MNIRNIRWLSYQKKILLFLLHYDRYREISVPPIEFTQHGMADYLGTKQPRICEALSKLREENNIEEKTTHVKNVNVRLKVYFLSFDGLNTAKCIRDNLKEYKIEFPDLGGYISNLDYNKDLANLKPDIPFYSLGKIQDEKRKWEEKLIENENDIKAVKKLKFINYELEDIERALFLLDKYNSLSKEKLKKNLRNGS